MSGQPGDKEKQLENAQFLVLTTAVHSSRSGSPTAAPAVSGDAGAAAGAPVPTSLPTFASAKWLGEKLGSQWKKCYQQHSQQHPSTHRDLLRLWKPRSQGGMHHVRDEWAAILSCWSLVAPRAQAAYVASLCSGDRTLGIAARASESVQ